MSGANEEAAAPAEATTVPPATAAPVRSPNLDRFSSSNWDEDNDEDEFYDAREYPDSEPRSGSRPVRKHDGRIASLRIQASLSLQSASMEVQKIARPLSSSPEREGTTLAMDEKDDADRMSAQSPIISRPEPEEDALRNQVVNLDTGEVMQIGQMDEGVDTFTSLLTAAPTEDVDQQEIMRKKISTGFFAKVFHRTTVSETADSNIVKVKTHKKPELELSELRHRQIIEEHKGPVWTMKWSPCGNFLATAGQDTTVRVWVVCGSDAHQKLEVEREEKADIDEKTSSASASSIDSDINMDKNILDPIPYRTYSGHKSDVIDLAWSKSSFLLSASMDKTARLWHVSKQRCLSSFQHADFVTGVCFHPIESRLFLSGSFDKKLRMWNILEHRVVEWAQTTTMITSATFSPFGKFAAAGLYNGQCVFYQSEGLKYFTQIDCRNRRGRYARGRKVTGLEFSTDGKQLLVSTNDSRIRLFDMDDFSMSMKYKGLINEQLQTRAHFSEDNSHIISGSDDAEIFMWKTNKDYGNLKNASLLRNRNDRNDSYEYFKAHGGFVTASLLAPSATLKFAGRKLQSQGASVQHIIVSAGYDGKIKVFENRGMPLPL